MPGNHHSDTSDASRAAWDSMVENARDWANRVADGMSIDTLSDDTLIEHYRLAYLREQALEPLIQLLSADGHADPDPLNALDALYEELEWQQDRAWEEMCERELDEPDLPEHLRLSIDRESAKPTFLADGATFDMGALIESWMRVAISFAVFNSQEMSAAVKTTTEATIQFQTVLERARTFRERDVLVNYTASN